MEVYLEVTYVLNGLMILLTFEILCFLLNQQLKIKELFKYVFTYNISILFLFIDFFDGFLLLYDLFLTWFYFKKMVYIYYPLYIFIYVSILVFIDMMLPSSTLFQGIIVVEGFHFITFMIIGMIVICVFYFYIMFCNHKINKDELVRVSFFGKECLGFIDTGNKVFYKGYPVIFMSSSLLDDYYAIDKIEIETASSKEWIDIVELDEIIIQDYVFHHVYVGVMSSKEYDCILNSELLGGML